MGGLSPRNLLFMRSFAAAYPDPQVVKQLVSQLPWGHIIRLLQRIKEPDTRHWYVKASVENGWSRNILEHQIDVRAHERHGKAITPEKRRRIYGVSLLPALVLPNYWPRNRRSAAKAHPGESKPHTGSCANASAPG